MPPISRSLTGVALALAPALACGAPRAQLHEGAASRAIQRGVASGEGDFDHGPWDGLLRRHVSSRGLLDYAGLAAQREALDRYLDAVAGAELETLSRDALLALLINAYNACTVRLILDDAGPGRLPDSIRDLDSPWERPVCTVGGEALALDTIEHGLIRPLFRDARIHAAVNCAARSCPPLAQSAFAGDRVEEQLQRAMERMIASEDHLRVEGERILASKIFDWYREDFVGGAFRDAAPSLPAYFRRYATGERARRLEALGESPPVEFLDYDWSLNRQ